MLCIYTRVYFHRSPLRIQATFSLDCLGQENICKTIGKEISRRDSGVVVAVEFADRKV